MIVIHPKKNVDDFINEFTIEQAVDLITKTKRNEYANVNLTMPKFDIESKISMVDTLRQLGVSDLFSGNAQLPFLTVNENIVISEVQQQAKMLVNEKGTIAAAVTAFEGASLSYTPPVRDVNMFVDKPFLVMIVDKTKKVPTFIAKVSNPTKSG
jgi:serpin B